MQRPMRGAWALAVAAALLLACGADAGAGRAGGDGGRDAAGDQGIDPADLAAPDSAGGDATPGDAEGSDGPADEPSADAPPGDAPSPDTGQDLIADEATADGRPDSADDPGKDVADPCAGLISALAAELYASQGACTLVVRLDYTTRAPLGYQVFCGPYAGVDEASARVTAQADTGYGAGGTMLNEDAPADAFVFYVAPGDFGGAAAVSKSTGLTAFGGSIVWDGTGDITYPASWRGVADLGADCSESGGIHTARGWDLVNGTALDDASVQAALDVVRHTAVPGAFWTGGYVFDAVVLLYPRSVGLFNPDTAEWIVMVNGGWLE
jgi:hypothetical protein